MDDLLDLDWSDAKKKAPAPLQPSSGARQTMNPTFDFLSKPLNPSSNKGPNLFTSTPPLRGTTPSTAPLPSQPRLATPSLVPRSSTPQPPPPAASTDAFSSLFSLGGTASTSSKTLSLAERQKQIAEEKQRKEEHERQQFTAHGSFWDDLGSTSNLSAVPAKTSIPTIKKPHDDFEDLLSPQPVRQIQPESLRPSRSPVSSSSSPLNAPKPSSVWDDDDTFLTASTFSNANGSSKSDTFDLGALSNSVDQLDTKHSNRPSRHGSPPRSDVRPKSKNLDYGAFDDDSDSLLGELGSSSSRPKVPEQPQKHRDERRSTSPPPHLVMQIMDMGFSPEQARAALVRTGLDVQAATEILLENPQGLLDSKQAQRPMEYRSREDSVESAAERHRRRRAGPSRSSVRPRSRAEIQQDEESRGEYGEQADKIIAQASEIGQNFLKGATSFWNSGKEKAMKMYEEQKRAAELANGKGKRRDPADGRPRWMVEAEEMEVDGAFADKNGFKDSDDETESKRGPVKPSSRNDRREPVPRNEPRRAEADLLGGGEAPRSYQPASRHRVPARPATASPRPPRVETPPLKQRSLVSASPAQVSTSTAHKAKGNEHFKLGRFAEAEAAYTAAITSLPDGHLHLVPIYNNRAATRIKLGESSSAAEDCSFVITIIGPTYHPSKEAPLPADHAEIKLGEALVKATVKRAQAWEMGEKWTKALEDWEKVIAFDAMLLGNTASATRSLASEGIKRAKMMIDPPKPAAPAPQPKKPVVKAKPSAPSTLHSKAVEERRKATKAAEAEDAQRFAAKDAVDAKIAAWKGGKETNLRALIASLDTVLWDDILSGGLKVGMHELITDKQVKIKYMKVIARLHPDKLDIKTTTIEQRMLANSAFSALNDAWQAFNNA